MLITTQININITPRNLKHFNSLGYICKCGDILLVNIEHLFKNSHIVIDVKCDICGTIKKISYQKYNKNISKYNIYTCSEKCAYKIKNTKTNIIKYGVEHPLKSKLIMNKLKNTVKNKYSVDNVFKLNDVKNKSINTNLLKYDVKYPQQNKLILEKSFNTCIEKYGFNRSSKNNIIKNKTSNTNKEKLINKFNNINIFNVDYDNNNLECVCNIGHKFNINIKTLYSRTNNNYVICTVCNTLVKKYSNLEQQLLLYITEKYNDTIILNNKSIISPYELDIYLPDLKLAFEFNGLYWHNELYKDKNYHKMKTDLCLEKGIDLIHIYEDDWNFKQNIVKSMILNKLNKTENKIFARKCEIKEIKDNKIIKDFLNENHLQGFVRSKIKIGLFYNNELISLIVFKKLKDKYELLRLCNKLNINIIGGTYKLFKYFIKTYKPSEITSYVDRSYNNGNLYKQLGFELDSITEPNYYYVIDGIKKDRKDILVKQGFDPSKSEHEIMLEHKIYRIYNSGNYKFKYF